MYTNNKIFFYPNKIDFSISKKEMTRKIKEADFLISDEKCIHRLIGLKYDDKTMSAPKITITCLRHEMATAKNIAFTFGKKIFYKKDLSARLCKYLSGQEILPSDYLPVAQVVADYYSLKNRK